VLDVKKLLNDYKPINYKIWDRTGQGNNILSLFTPLEKDIWLKAYDFQDKRDDAGHVENVTCFAVKLIEYIPKANRNIVIPAAILHDTGWSQMTDTELKLFYISNWKDYEKPLRENHQKKSVEVADKILTQVKHPQEFRRDILEIISQHDTRDGFSSLEDGVVRDADKLWRYTLPHLELTLNKRNKTPEELREDVYGYFSKPKFFYSDISKEIGRIEFEHAMEIYKIRESKEDKKWE